jgi:hypothetical protein
MFLKKITMFLRKITMFLGKITMFLRKITQLSKYLLNLPVRKRREITRGYVIIFGVDLLNLEKKEHVIVYIYIHVNLEDDTSRPVLR